MKKIKLFLLSAAIVAAGSAFISRPMVDEYVKDNNVWKLKSMASGSCQTQESSHCTFVLKPNATVPYDDSELTPNDQNRIWIPTP